MIKYNTILNRYNLAQETMTSIDRYNQSIKDMVSQGDSSLNYMKESSNEDVQDRTDSIRYAQLIYDAIKEMGKLDDSYRFGLDFLKWTNIEDIDLFSYFPKIIKDSKTKEEAKEYLIKDFHLAHMIFKKYNGKSRGTGLNDFDGFYYDDHDVMVQKKTRTRNNYTRNWLGVRKFSGTSVDTYTTDKNPRIPDIASYRKIISHAEVEREKRIKLEFQRRLEELKERDSFSYFAYSVWRNLFNKDIKTLEDTSLVIKDGPFGTSFKSSIEQIRLARDLRNGKEDKNILSQLRASANDIINEKMFVITGSPSEIIAMYHSLPKVLYFEDYYHPMKWVYDYDNDYPYYYNGHWEYDSSRPSERVRFMAELVFKDLKGDAFTIKDAYKNDYNNSDDIVKYYVYDNICYEDYYKDANNKKIYVQYKFMGGEVSENSKYKSIIPKGTIDPTGYQDLCRDLKDDIIGRLDETINAYNSGNPLTRCEDFLGDKGYKEIRSAIAKLPLTNLNECDAFTDYIINTVIPWTNKRAYYLIEHLTEKNNIRKITKLLKKRLTKNTGSLMIWYQSVLQFDDSYDKINLMKELAINNLNKCLITKAYNDGLREDMFNRVKNPYYIDIEEPDPLYGNINFNSGDEIYIAENGLHDQLNKIVRKEIIYVKDTDYSNLNPDELSGSEIVEDAISKEKPVTRLILSKSLPNWCNTDDPSNIRIMRIKS